MIENILFDLDGTLTDPKIGITRCIQFSLAHFDVQVPETDDLTWCIGPPLRESFSRLLNTADDNRLDLALANYRKRFSESGMFENIVFPEIPSSLEKIKGSGFRIFLATSKPRVFAEQILDHFGLMRFFDAVYGAELNGSLVDKGDLIAHIIESEGLDPERSLMVGDRVYDIAGGKKNGVMTAAVSYGYGSRDEIALSDPDLIFDRFSDLTVFLKIT
jgi:phosphoglycolate phosphatase